MHVLAPCCSCLRTPLLYMHAMLDLVGRMVRNHQTGDRSLLTPCFVGCAMHFSGWPSCTLAVAICLPLGIRVCGSSACCHKPCHAPMHHHTTCSCSHLTRTPRIPADARCLVPMAKERRSCRSWSTRVNCTQVKAERCCWWPAKGCIDTLLTNECAYWRTLLKEEGMAPPRVPTCDLEAGDVVSAASGRAGTDERPVILRRYMSAGEEVCL